jgi:hypothetical protein
MRTRTERENLGRHENSSGRTLEKTIGEHKKLKSFPKGLEKTTIQKHAIPNESQLLYLIFSG